MEIPGSIRRIGLAFIAVIYAQGYDDIYSFDNYPATYNAQQQIPVFLGKLVGDTPFTYHKPDALSICDFFNLDADKIVQMARSFGAEIKGDSWMFNPRVNIHFGVDVNHSDLCFMPVQGTSFNAVKRHIEEGLQVVYWLDGLPSLTYLGFIDRDVYYVYTHRNFEVVTNDKQVLGFEVTPGQPQRLEQGKNVHFTYSVAFADKGAELTLDNRYDALLEDSYLAAVIQEMFLVSAFGFAILVAVFVGYLFSILFTGEGGTDSEWSLVPEQMLKVSLLKPFYYVKPKHTTILSVLFTFGAQIVITYIFVGFLWGFTSKESLVKGQLDGFFLTSVIRCFISAYVFSGAMGGAFLKFWRVRRYKQGVIVQFFLPVLMAGIVLVQLRSGAVVAGTTLAWSTTMLLKIMGKSLLCFCIHAFGFYFGHFYMYELTAPEGTDTPKDTIKANSTDLHSKAILLGADLVAVVLCFVTGLHHWHLYMDCLFVSNICVVGSLFPLFLYLVPSLTLFVTMVIIIAYVSLCLGESEWQTNCYYIGMIWFILQYIATVRWWYQMGRMVNVYSGTWIMGGGLLMAFSSAMAAFFIAYATQWISYKLVFDERKAD